MDHVSLLHLAWKGQYSSFQESLLWKDTFHCCCMRTKPSDSDVKGRGTSGKGHYPLFQLIWENSCVINLYWWFQNVRIHVLSCPMCSISLISHFPLFSRIFYFSPLVTHSVLYPRHDKFMHCHVPHSFLSIYFSLSVFPFSFTYRVCTTKSSHSFL